MNMPGTPESREVLTDEMAENHILRFKPVQPLRSPCLLPVWTAIRLAPRNGRAHGDQRKTDPIYAQSCTLLIGSGA